MATSGRSWGAQLGIASCLAMGGGDAYFGDCALAQIIPDGTLPNNSIVTPQSNTSVIEGGTQAGGNLFHSFDEFSVTTGGAAYFNNAPNIQNIISRVTGESSSNIDGLIRANGTANLFLLNPKGIIFGPNASLNIGGSFVGSTASSLNFADGTQFSAIAHPTTPLLTVSVPLGLQYGETVGGISVQGSSLEMQAGKTLSLVGGNVRLDGGNLQAPGGRVELGGVAGAGTVGLQVDGNNLSLNYPASVQRADVSLTNGAGVGVAQGGGGSISVNARNLDVLGGSILLAGIESGQGSVTSQAGDITLNATGAVSIANNSFIFNAVQPGAVGNSGDINITTGSLSVTNGAQLNSSTFGQGNAGSVSVRANDSVSLANNSIIYSTVQSGAMGNGGNINITARSLSLDDDSELNTGTIGQGDAGNVVVQVKDTVSLVNSSILSNVGNNQGAAVEGNVGNILIEAGAVSLTDTAQLQAGIYSGGQGNASIVSVRGRDSVSFAGRNSGIFTDVESGAVGNGSDIQISAGSVSLTNGAVLKASNAGHGNSGDITIETGRLSVSNGAQVSASTFGIGNVGALTVRASDAVELSGSGRLSAQVDEGAEGSGGNLTIETESLSIRDGAQVSVSTSGAGAGGTLSVTASDAVELIGESADGQFPTGLFADTQDDGNAGDLTIATGRLLVRDGALVSASTSGTGAGGTLSVTASDAVELIGESADGQFPSGLFVQTQGAGAAGDLSIETRRLIVRDGANINAEAVPDSTGQGGTLTVTASESVEVIGATDKFSSTLSVDTRGEGAAGDLTIATGKLTIQGGAQVSASTSGMGDGGDLTVRASKVEVVGTTANGEFSSLLTTQTGGFATQTTDTEAAQTADTGAAGDLTIETGSLIVRDGAQVLASTFGAGSGGTLKVSALESVELIGTTADGSTGSGLFADTSGAGAAGDLTIATGQLIVRDGAQAGAGTFGEGQGGTFEVTASESVELIGTTADGSTGSGLFTQTEGAGAAGDLKIETGQLTVGHGARVSVSSEGSGDAGDLEVVARSIQLDNQGELRAETASGQGGNITLQAQDLLLLRRSSQISTTAGNAGAGGNGGNITIDTPFIVANPSENSDITANAFSGNGGNIQITTSGIFGTQFRESDTPQSDITASSELGLQGSVEINTPGVNPSQGLIELPAELVDASNQIAPSCAAVAENKFTITGRGGLPPNPLEPLSGSMVLTNLATLDSEVENRSGAAPSTNPTRERAPTQIVEATGWVINDKGEVVLTANAPNATPHIPWLPSPNCHAPQNPS